jgi:membrane protein insertase Oxa1/YidC/SpoIIIJ
MFLGFPSGLAIYYLVSNLIQIGQQYFTNRIIGPPPQVAVRPAAERRVKSVGSGRTQAAEEKK